jgi:hypothetical protein
LTAGKKRSLIHIVNGVKNIDKRIEYNPQFQKYKTKMHI